MQHPGFRHQTTKQGGQQHHQQEHDPIDSPLGHHRMGTGALQRNHQLFSDSTAGPAERHQGQGRSQLGCHQHAPEPELKLGHGMGPGLTGLLELPNPAGPEANQGEFPCRKEGQKGQKHGQGQKSDHRKTKVGVARIELA